MPPKTKPSKGHGRKTWIPNPCRTLVVVAVSSSLRWVIEVIVNRGQGRVPKTVWPSRFHGVVGRGLLKR
ncbi:hypothetical protein R1flu_006913 [Riccia fluitans]|uniref:Uncharacterized protein n=1 Tax=Riccia fluitans TaxID=41844 RepID=A0ABD1YXD1_9MARC